nr:hypothetical protein [Nucisporomicrobium flavum]
MAILHSSHTLTLRPDYCTLLLRDIDCDAGVGASTAMDEARRNVAASSGYGVYISARQNLIAVRVDGQVWDSVPAPVVGEEWAGPVSVELDCPTRLLQVGDMMGNAIDGINPPPGPGRYTVYVYHRGRERAVQAEDEIHQVMGATGDDEQIDALQARYEGIERYLLRLWGAATCHPTTKTRTTTDWPCQAARCSRAGQAVGGRCSAIHASTSSASHTLPCCRSAAGAGK